MPNPANYIVVSRSGACGRITLNRPRVLHAMDRAMCERVSEALLSWREDDGVEFVVLDHDGPRGFCAGGDVRAAALDVVATGGVEARAFFRAEYQLNHLIFAYPKPIVAFLDGVTMGGGVGVSAPAAYRVATENTRWAMPETGIGLFPDAGGGWHLSRLPGRIGVFLALTGMHLGAADCLDLGLATHNIPSSRLSEVKARLFEAPARRITDILSAFSEAAGAGMLSPHRAVIDSAFAHDTVEAIVAALAASADPWAQAQRSGLAKRSPRSLKVALAQQGKAKHLTSFADNMRMEFDLVRQIIAAPDFYEGVRALLIDKDLQPKWSPAALERVSDSDIETLFEPLLAPDAWTPLL